jgi:hypothetical protein
VGLHDCLHGYWILCVTPKTRFPGEWPTKSRHLTRSRQSDLAEPRNATNAACLISGLHFRASPWLSEQTNAHDMRPHRVQFFLNLPRPFRVNLVVLTVRRSIPVYPN